MREIKSKRRRRKPACVALAVIYSILTLVFTGMLVWLNILPLKYLIPVIVLVFIVSFFIVCFLILRKPKSKRRVAGTIAAILLMIIYGVGIYYIYCTQDLFSKISTMGQETEEFYVITTKDDEERNAIGDINGDTVYIPATKSPAYNEAMSRIDELTDVNYKEEKKIFDIGKKLLNDKCDVMMVSSTNYTMICESNKSFEDKTKIIYKVPVSIESDLSSNSVEKITKMPFNVFVSGIDIFGEITEVSLFDVNMVMTVNPVTKTILLTSIPRDSYVMLHTAQQMDKLTHTGAYGTNETVMTVEDLLGIDINYYIKVNFSTVVDVVDAIGGITVKSDYDFTTHGRQNTGYTFKKGKNELDGKAALAFARERYSFVDGDLQRNKHQQVVLKAILNKVLSSETLLMKYSQLLDAVENEMQTSISKAEIQSLVKMQIDDMKKWNIVTQSINGDVGTDYCYTGGNASVVYPDVIDLKKAYKKIEGVKNGSKQADGEWTWDFE